MTSHPEDYQEREADCKQSLKDVLSRLPRGFEDDEDLERRERKYFPPLYVTREEFDEMQYVEWRER